jgi:hypothetical protein
MTREICFLAAIVLSFVAARVALDRHFHPRAGNSKLGFTWIATYKNVHYTACNASLQELLKEEYISTDLCSLPTDGQN